MRCANDDRAWRKARDATEPRQSIKQYCHASKGLGEKKPAVDTALQQVEKAEETFPREATAGMFYVVKSVFVGTMIKKVATKIREQPIDRRCKPVVLPYLTWVHAFSPTDTCWNIEKKRRQREANGKHQFGESAAVVLICFACCPSKTDTAVLQSSANTFAALVNLEKEPYHPRYPCWVACFFGRPLPRPVLLYTTRVLSPFLDRGHNYSECAAKLPQCRDCCTAAAKAFNFFCHTVPLPECVPPLGLPGPCRSFCRIRR